jgi:hypothetical protein
MLDTYRNNILRKRTELAKLSQDRAKESSKIAALQQKITSAKKSISSTKSQSTINSKLNEISRHENEIANINKRISDFDVKLSKKDKEIADEEKKYRNEEGREIKKSAELEKKRIQESNRALQKINYTLSRHSKIQNEIQQSIIDLQTVPEKIKVLFMASNPIGSVPLRLDEEARSIQEMIRKSEHRDSVEFVTRWAVRSSDILQAINEENPDVIHFSGHGTDTDELVLQNTDGSPKFISKEAITQTITTVSDKIRLVFFNTCFSFGQAEAIVANIDAAIGMTTSIGDDAAIVFAAQFYSSIGFGKSLKISFQQAKAALLLEGILEENTPVLYVKDGLDLDNIYIVRP